MNLDNTERRTHVADMEIVKQIENLCGGPNFVLTRLDPVVAVMQPIENQRIRAGQRDAIDQFSYED